MLKTIVGKRGRGKTTLARNFIQESKADQIFILDFQIEYFDLKSDKIFVYCEDLATFYNRIRDRSNEKIKTLIILDEIDLYGFRPLPIIYLYRYSRHVNADIIAISRRFYEMPVITRAMTDEFYLFQITEPVDLKYLRRLAPEDKILKLIKLKHWEYLTVKLN